jgi:ATP-binding cassette, subfamily B, bacterial
LFRNRVFRQQYEKSIEKNLHSTVKVAIMVAFCYAGNMRIGLIFKYYWPHVKKYKKSGILAVLGYGIGVIGVSAITPLLYKRIIDIVSTVQDASIAGEELMVVVLTLGGLILLYNVFFRIADYTMAFSQSHIGKDIFDDAFSRLQKHSYEFFASEFAGALVARVKRYVDAFETIHDQIIFNVWMGGLQLFLIVTVLTWFSPPLGGIFFVWLVLYIAITLIFTKKKVKKDLLESEANSKVTGVLADVITNILNVKMFASHRKEAAIFSSATKLERDRRKSALYFQNLQFSFQAYFIGVFEFVGMFVAAKLWMNGAISAGTILLVQIYVIHSFEIVWDIGRNFTRAMRAFAEAKEMVDLFEKPIGVKDPVEPEECKFTDGHTQIQGISFSYADGGRVFANFSLDINPGEKVGLVGPSGAGKTTITKLLLRFADLSKGKILIDGQDISKVSQDDLRKKISYVPQDPVIFHRSIKENIAYASPNAKDADVIKAAKKAHAHGFITRLPKGYKTLVGERGIKLSGGERQRVAIARAMLKDAPILILDEATSSLDSISEKHIQGAFNALMEGRTTIVIAHRLSTIQKMDRIVVLEEGKIAEEGAHEALLAKNGLYSQLWRQQSHGFVGG